MKKYPVSKHMIGVFVTAIVMALVLGIVIVDSIIKFGIDFPSGSILFACLTVIICYSYIFFFDLPTAKYSFSEEGITMYVGFKKYEHRWSDFISAGIIFLELGVGGNMPTLWVYFSESYLTLKEKQCFLRKTRRNLNGIAYFQYSEPAFGLVMEKLPENLREQLEFEKKLIFDP